MSKVVVDHTGLVRSNETGRAHAFEAGVPVELPEDAVKALGQSAKSADEVAAEEAQVKEKEVKNKKDRQVKSGETVTK